MRYVLKKRMSRSLRLRLLMVRRLLNWRDRLLLWWYLTVRRSLICYWRRLVRLLIWILPKLYWLLMRRWRMKLVCRPIFIVENVVITGLKMVCLRTRRKLIRTSLIKRLWILIRAKNSLILVLLKLLDIKCLRRIFKRMMKVKVFCLRITLMTRRLLTWNVMKRLNGLKLRLVYIKRRVLNGRLFRGIRVLVVLLLMRRVLVNLRSRLCLLKCVKEMACYLLLVWYCLLIIGLWNVRNLWVTRWRKLLLAWKCSDVRLLWWRLCNCRRMMASWWTVLWCMMVLMRRLFFMTRRAVMRMTM